MTPASRDLGDVVIERIEVRDSETVAEANHRVQQLPGVIRSAIEQRFVEMGTPNDPQFKVQWHLSDIGLESAWDITNGAGTVVAVLDSGLSTGGDDAPCSGIVYPYNAITQTEGIDAVVDRSGHGTHVTGTVAQCTNNGTGVAGVAHGAAVMPIKVLDSVDGGGTTLEMVRGIEWAIDHGADVINISLASEYCGPTYDAVLSPRFQSAIDAGIVIVVAAGNAESSPACLRYPASDSLTLAIGASTINSTVSSYSERGAGLMLVAPGGDSGNGSVFQETTNGGSYAVEGWIGTSMASPHVAGVAALLKALDPTLDQSNIESILTSTATDIGPTGWDSDSGAGILNAGAAVAAIDSEPLPTTVVGGTAAVTEAQVAELSAATALDVTRISSSNRYATAAAISAAALPGGSAKAFVVTGESFADALGVGPVAHLSGAPILLTSTASVPSATLEELKRLSLDEILVVGGTATISESVISVLGEIAPTTRIAGPNRYATAALLSSSHLASATTVYIVNGAAFPDGLAGGPLAAVNGAPILLTRSDSLPSETRAEIQRLGAAKAIVIGGTAVVSSGVVSALSEIVSTVDRIAGSNRYATAAAVAAQFPNPVGVTIASGLTFPDALSATPLAAMNSSPILLVGSGAVAGATLSAIDVIAR
jgi:cell wall-associated protease